MFDKIKKSVKKFTGMSLAGEEEIKNLVKDIQRSLLRSDVDVELVYDLSERIKERSLEEDVPKAMTRKEHVLNIVYEELVKFLGEEKAEIEIEPKRIMVLGLFGAGKTTTVGKLANFYRKRGLKPGIIAADVDRPAAQDQLEQIADDVGVEVYTKGDDAAEIAEKGREYLEDKGCEVIILDSAGRDSMDNELAEELENINHGFRPEQKYLVVSGDIGQSAKEQANRFNDLVNIDGVIVTKMDSSAKGGGAISSCAHSEANVKFIGTGEDINDLKVYDPVDFVSQMLGTPDLQSLIEKAQESVDEEQAKKFLEGEFTLKDFSEQLNSMSDMGAMDKIMDQLPFSKDLPDNIVNMQQEKAEKYEYIIKSMTIEEMNDPKIIDRSRAERIAEGSGTSVTEVRELIKQYRQTKNMMDKFSGRSMKRGSMKKLMSQFSMK